MFYGAVVVPVGSGILQSHTTQGFVTRSVTNFLNLAGVLAVGVWLLELMMTRESRTTFARLRWLGWGLIVTTLCLQGWLHLELDAELVPELHQVLDRPRFQSLHSWYLIVSTVQWALALVLLVLTLNNWQANDRLWQRVTRS